MRLHGPSNLAKLGGKQTIVWEERAGEEGRGGRGAVGRSGMRGGGEARREDGGEEGERKRGAV